MSNPQVKLSTTHGDITIELFEQEAPLSVANFLSYVNDGHYNGLIFHRVIPGFMVQGGGMDAEMDEKDTEPPIKNEAENGLKNDRGTLAMARTQVVDSATSQFFINLVDNDFLNFKSPDMMGFGYCVFGKVTDGMDAVDAIAKVPTGNSGYHQDVPRESVVINSAIAL
ncbi:MAG: peptidylprolyl isomerase [Lentisphaeria bacterium]|nr:peptidylprolyl isomerase [Lentisphaeria bacterium]